MNLAQIHIRRFKHGEERVLWQICYSSIHKIARSDYTKAQLNAWAPIDLDENVWVEKIRKNQPFVAELNGQLVGYADIQPNGFIDHFFVSGNHARQGIGSALMTTLEHQAQQMYIPKLSAYVSSNAQKFFERFGFVVQEHRTSTIRGQQLANALMGKYVS